MWEEVWRDHRLGWVPWRVRAAGVASAVLGLAFGALGLLLGIVPLADLDLGAPDAMDVLERAVTFLLFGAGGLVIAGTARRRIRCFQAYLADVQAGRLAVFEGPFEVTVPGEPESPESFVVVGGREFVVPDSGRIGVTSLPREARLWWHEPTGRVVRVECRPVPPSPGPDDIFPREPRAPTAAWGRCSRT